MEHTDIAPLARRLAEENNVEWRRLRGSGERGRVVERDVLEYLARVMAGEEDVDPTPEPVPEGMQAWPDDDVRAFEQEKRAETVPPVFGTSTVDDEIFLLDADEEDLGGEFDVEEPGSAYGAAAYGGDAHPAYDRSDPRAEEDVELAPIEGVIEDISDDDDLLVAGDDQAHAQAAPPMVDVRTPDAGAVYTEHAQERAFASDDGDADLLPDLFDDRPAERDWDEGPVFGDDGFGVHESAVTGPSLDMDADDGVVGSGGAWGVSDEDASGSDHKEAEYAPSALEEDRALDASGIDAPDGHASGDDRGGHDAFGERPSDAPFQADGVDQPAQAPLETPDAEAAPEEVTPEGTRLDAGESAPAGMEPGADAEPLHATSSYDAPPVVVPVDPRAIDDGDGLDEDHGVVAGRVGEGLPLVSHGAVFRRQVDLSNLVAAQGDIARDLGLDEPVPLIAFLARAAAKVHGGGSAVGVAVFHDQAVRTVSLDVAARSFADVLDAIEGLAETPDARAEDLDLVVADLADLDLDEAVLHLGAPVLAVGRVLIDTSTGGRRATLTLSGPDLGRDAAGILARTAELLETPIRVVL